jgi:virginiamycin B lyase
VPSRPQGRLGTIDVRGRVHEFQIPDGVNGAAVPQGIVVGPGPHIWFTDQNNDRIGDLNRMTGSFTLYPIPTAGGFPLGLTRGPDGNLWFTERLADKVARMTPSGAFTEWDLVPGAFPNRIVTGPDGALCFAELRGGNIGRITTAGQLTEIPVDGGPVGITLAPDGHLYAAMFLSSQLAQLDDHGHVSRTWDVPGALQVAASQGALWVTDPFGNTLSQVRTHCDR